MLAVLKCTVFPTEVCSIPTMQLLVWGNVIAELWEDICRDFAQILLKAVKQVFQNLAQEFVELGWNLPLGREPVWDLSIGHTN